MNDSQRDELISSLAKTLALTRSEIDGMRMVLQASLNTIATQPHLATTFKAMLQHVKEADAAISLATQMPDAFLAAREAWVKKLTPANMQ